VPDWQTRCGFWPAQFWHCPPPAPHAVCWVPTAQMSPTQQPLHVAGLQSLPLTHWPCASQVWLGPHVLHA